MTSEQEDELEKKGLTYPRVTNKQVENSIDEEFYFTAGQGAQGAGYFTHTHSPLKTITFCVLVLRNGFTVTGESACVGPRNFDVQIGRDIARENAISKIWQLEGYLLKEFMYKEEIV